MKGRSGDSRVYSKVGEDNKELEMFLGPYMGYKVLEFQNVGMEEVVSPYRRSYRWWPKRGPQAADCRLSDSRRGFVHEAPRFACTCGFHAYLEFNDALNCKTLFKGYGKVDFYFVVLVAGWGDLITHENGYRCQRMDIAAVHNGPYVWREKLHDLAIALGVPFLAGNDITDYASEYGTVLTSDTIP